MTGREWVLLGLVGAAIALAAGCAGPRETIRIPERVYLDRPVPCLSDADVPQRPAMASQAEVMAMDDYRATHALWASYGPALAYISELEAAVGVCSRIPAPDP